MSLTSLIVSKNAFKLGAITLAVALAGCGGGDGSDILAPRPDLGVQPGEGSGNQNVIKQTNISAISMTDSSGQMTRIVTSSGVTASVKVTNNNGEPISGALVTFSTDAPMSSMLFGSTNGTTLTNAEGIAIMNLRAVSATDTGSYALFAKAQFNNNEDSNPSYFYSLQKANLIFDSIAVQKSQLPFGGSTDITGFVKNSDTMQPQKDVEVSFAATCGTISNAKTNILGFKATYEAGDCEGAQTITAVIDESGAVTRIPITIDRRSSLGALSIQCISGDTPSFPDSSNVSGSDNCAQEVILGTVGSLTPSNRTIEFVVNQADKPFANERVKVELLRAPNDFGIGSSGNQQSLTLTTDQAGRIRVPLIAGATQQNGVAVRATLLSRVDVTATVSNINVISSAPTQAGFTVTPTKNVLAATETSMSNAGATEIRRLTDATTLNVVARDGRNGFVNGATVHFIAEGGTLSPNSCVLNNGRCQVILSTKGVIPDDRRVTVLAYTSSGEKAPSGFKTFLDENENGKIDKGEVEITSIEKLVYKQFIIGFADITPTFNPEVDKPSLAANETGTSQRTFMLLGSGKIEDQAISMPSGTKVQVQATDKSNNNHSCSVQLINNGITSNILTVPLLTNLYVPETPSIPVLKQDNTDKKYILRTQNCGVGDEIKLTVTTPAPNSKSTIKMIEVK